MKYFLSILFSIIFFVSTAQAKNLESVDEILRKKSDEISIFSQNISDMIVNIPDREYKAVTRALDREMLFEIRLSDLQVMLHMHIYMVNQKEKKNSQKFIQLVCKQTKLAAMESIRFINEALPVVKEDALVAELTKLRGKIQDVMDPLDKCEQ